MESEVKRELLRLAIKLRKRLRNLRRLKISVRLKFEKVKDFGKAEQCRVYAAYLEETARNMD